MTRFRETQAAHQHLVGLELDEKVTIEQMATACSHVVYGGYPILVVRHNPPVQRIDSGWLFHCGRQEHTDEESLPLLLSNAFSLDPSVGELADMPEGYRAFRQEPGGAWHSEPFTME